VFICCKVPGIILLPVSYLNTHSLLRGVTFPSTPLELLRT